MHLGAARMYISLFTSSKRCPLVRSLTQPPSYAICMHAHTRLNTQTPRAGNGSRMACVCVYAMMFLFLSLSLALEGCAGKVASLMCNPLGHYIIGNENISINLPRVGVRRRRLLRDGGVVHYRCALPLLAVFFRCAPHML